MIGPNTNIISKDVGFVHGSFRIKTNQVIGLTNQILDTNLL
jgi:hypothetical protein